MSDLLFTGIVHVGTQDPASTLRFWSDLGFSPEGEGESLTMSLEDGFRVWPIVVADNSGPEPGEAIMVFSTTDVRATHKRLMELGWKFLCEPVNDYGPWEVHLRDPNGLWVMLIERPGESE